jgi:hypothetical protein
MESKYLKLPLIEVSNFDKDSVLSNVSKAGLYLVTDGYSVSLFRVYTYKNPGGAINKRTNFISLINREDIFETVY